MFFKTSYSVQNDITITRENLNKKKWTLKVYENKNRCMKYWGKYLYLDGFCFQYAFNVHLCMILQLTRENLNKE